MERQSGYRENLQTHIENARSEYHAKLDQLHSQLQEYAMMGTELEVQRQQLQDHKKMYEQTLSQISKFEFEQ